MMYQELVFPSQAFTGYGEEGNGNNSLKIEVKGPLGEKDNNTSITFPIITIYDYNYR